MPTDIIARSAVVLRPKQSYLAWMRLDDKEELADAVMETLAGELESYAMVGDLDQDEAIEHM